MQDIQIFSELGWLTECSISRYVSELGWLAECRIPAGQVFKLKEQGLLVGGLGSGTKHGPVKKKIRTDSFQKNFNLDRSK